MVLEIMLEHLLILLICEYWLDNSIIVSNANNIRKYK